VLSSPFIDERNVACELKLTTEHGQGKENSTITLQPDSECPEKTNLASIEFFSYVVGQDFLDGPLLLVRRSELLVIRRNA
jgi:hypothetical protein